MVWLEIGATVLIWDELDEEIPDWNRTLFDWLSSVTLTRFAAISGALSTDGIAKVGEFNKFDRNECVSDKYGGSEMSWDIKIFKEVIQDY